MFRHNGFQNGQPTGYHHGAYLQNITDSVFANCIFWDNGGWGVHGYNGGSATSVRRTIFANDLAYGNVVGNGFELWQDSAGATPQTIPGDNDIVNFVSVNHTDTADGRTAYVFRNGSVAPDILNRLRNSLGYNPLTIASTGATTYTVANYLTSNPLFVNPTAGDFTPGVGSPLYAAGLAAYTPPFDFYGRPRVVATIGPLIAAAEK